MSAYVTYLDATNVSQAIKTESGTGATGSPFVFMVGSTCGATGAAVPTNAIMVAGTDGTDLRALLTDTGGQLKVLIENTPAVTISSGTVAVTGTFWQATQPISAAALPLPSGAATSANQATEITGLAAIVSALGSPFQAGGSIGNTTFAATQATAASLNATVVGTGTFAVQAACTGTVALSAGSAVIGHVIVDSGTVTTVSTVTVVTAVTSITNTVTTSEVTPTTIVNGLKNVTTAGTRVTLASTTAIKSVTVKARRTNTGLIYVGNATVASTNGIQLAAGESVSMEIADLATVNIDADVNGEGVTYLGVAA